MIRARWTTVVSEKFHGAGGICPFYNVTLRDNETGRTFQSLMLETINTSSPYVGQTVVFLATQSAWNRVLLKLQTPFPANDISQLLGGIYWLGSQPFCKAATPAETSEARQLAGSQTGPLFTD